jgi:outer membrane lipoprotein SlyB
MFSRTVCTLVTVGLVAGCATTRGSSYVPLVDMQGKDDATFQTDTRQCQGYAKQRMDAAEGAAAGAVAGALLGALLAPRGYRGYVGARVAGAGAIAGGVQANDTQETIVKRCLAGRGYNVLN